MSDWQNCKLQDIVIDLSMGPFGSNIKAENFVKTGVPIIRGKNLNFHKYVGGDFVYLTEEKANQLKRSNCFPGDLVFTHRGTIGQVGLIPERPYQRYVISQSGMRLTVDKNKADEHYLFYFFKSEKGQHELLKNESQVGVPAISNPLTSLKSVNISLPPLPGQKVIAEVLSSLDDKIDLLHRQNKTLSALAETLFRQWFVEEASEDWECVTLGYFVELHYGKGLKKSIRSGVGYPVIGSSGIVDYHSEFFVEGPGIVIGRKGTLGKTIYVPENFYPIDTTYYVKPKNNIGYSFIYYLLNSIDFKEMNSDSAVPGLNRDIVLGVEIKLPPIEVIHEFEYLADSIFKKINNNKLQIRSLEKLRDALLPKLMTVTEILQNYSH